MIVAVFKYADRASQKYYLDYEQLGEQIGLPEVAIQEIVEDWFFKTDQLWMVEDLLDVLQPDDNVESIFLVTDNTGERQWKQVSEEALELYKKMER